MKILFLIYHGFSEVSGISKKIRNQVKGLRESGHEVHLCYYDKTENGQWCRFVDDIVLADYGKGMLAGLRQRTEYNRLFDYCQLNGIEFVYARCFQNANPWLIRFFSRLRAVGIHAVTEIPTYPYDKEFVGFPLLTRIELYFDQLFRRRLYAQMDAIVTFSDAKNIFGRRTICISNGVDLDSTPLHRLEIKSACKKNSALHFIGVAEVHYWHGYDRLIAGLGEYYIHTDQPREVFFHIVGGVSEGEMYNSMHAPGFAELIAKYRIKDRIFFHGQLFGERLDEVFNQCQFAIGSLGRHRSGITVIKTLKNREYATRGIPFIYSELDSDFEHQPYVLKAPANESPIDIQRIIDFVDSFTMKPIEIRKTVEHLSWKNQMQKVIEQTRYNYEQ